MGLLTLEHGKLAYRADFALYALAVPTLTAYLLWTAPYGHWLSASLGVLAGYLAYAVTHHAAHHWRADNAWLAGRKRWHALHHHAQGAGCYGVTSALWDHAFGSARRAAPGRRAETVSRPG